MDTPVLLRLPDDAARQLAAQLERQDLENLTAVNRVASRDSFFQAMRDARPASLLLPYSESLAELLVLGIHKRNPLRLASFETICIHAAWQAKLLANPSIADAVTSVTVESNAQMDTTETRAVLAALHSLPNLRKLDLSDVALDSVNEISVMTQLRELNLSRTSVSDLAGLSMLTSLEVLIMEDTKVLDLSCIEHMASLHVLKVALAEEVTDRRASNPAKTFIPSLRLLTQLHTLELKQCEVLNTADLLYIAGNLVQLTLLNVSSREPSFVNQEIWPPRDVNENAVLEQLQKLKTVEISESHATLSGATEALAMIPSLEVIQHSLDEDLGSLATLVNLQEIDLMLPEGNYGDFMHRRSEDYGVLLRMPQLNKVKVQQTTEMPWHWLPDFEEIHDQLVQAHGTTLTDVLTRLPALKHLHYSGYIPSHDILLRFSHLESLTLRHCAPHISSFGWIEMFSSLRSLDIVTSPTPSDFSAIGSLKNLEELRFFIQPKCDTSFLSGLVGLKKLELTGHVYNLVHVRDLTSLEELTIQSLGRKLSLESLRSLVGLKRLDVRHTKAKDLAPIGSLPNLRVAVIASGADCRPLAVDGPERLIRILHPDRNCLSWCYHREMANKKGEQ